MNPLLLKFSVLLLLWFGIYWQTSLSMFLVWSNSETFKHCFLIIPLVLFLFWERRAQLRSFHYSASHFFLPLLLLIQGAHFVALQLNIDLISHLAWYASLVCLLGLCFGFHFIKFFSFPLLYLAFVIPFGDELVPVLQDVTAYLTVELLRLVNIPVYRDGLYLYVPNGTFLVAEACAGIRFLIASLALGTLYAYMNYKTKWKIALFILAALIVPIVANGVRAFGIVLIGYYTDMKHAVGADHLVYGWWFFAFVLVVLFLLGNIGREKVIWDQGTQTSPPSPTVITNSSLSCAVIFLLFAPVYSLSLSSDNQTMGELNLLANLQKEFVVSKSTLAWQPQINAPHEVFSGHLDGIQVYIAKFHFDNDRAELVSGVNRYYNIDHWTKKSHTHVALDQGKVGALQLVNVSGVNIRLYYWFEVDGIKTQGLLATKINQLKSKLQGNGGRGSFVAVAHNDQDRVGSLALKLSPFL